MFSRLYIYEREGQRCAPLLEELSIAAACVVPGARISIVALTAGRDATILVHSSGGRTDAAVFVTGRDSSWGVWAFRTCK